MMDNMSNSFTRSSLQPELDEEFKAIYRMLHDIGKYPKPTDPSLADASKFIPATDEPLDTDGGHERLRVMLLQEMSKRLAIQPVCSGEATPDMDWSWL